MPSKGSWPKGFGVLLLEIVSGRCHTDPRLPFDKQFLLEKVKNNPNNGPHTVLLVIWIWLSSKFRLQTTGRTIFYVKAEKHYIDDIVQIT
jgi:hypothetical protein